jgi:hypothetical protein
MAEKVREFPPRTERSVREEKKEMIKRLTTNITIDTKRKARGLVAVRVLKRESGFTAVVSFNARTAGDARSRRWARE